MASPIPAIHHHGGVGSNWSSPSTQHGLPSSQLQLELDPSESPATWGVAPIGILATNHGSFVGVGGSVPVASPGARSLSPPMHGASITGGGPLPRFNASPAPSACASVTAYPPLDPNGHGATAIRRAGSWRNASNDSLTACDFMPPKPQPRHAHAAAGGAGPLPPKPSAPAPLGRGAFGSVRVARRNGVEVAIKTMKETGSDDRSAAASAEAAFGRRYRDAKARGLPLENVVAVHDVRRDPSGLTLTITMELATGGAVAARAASLEAPYRLAGAASPEAYALALGSLTRLARECLTGLSTLHDTLRVIHRDLKPANVLLRGDGTAVLCDFGCCAVLTPKQQSTPEKDARAAKDQRGSVLYMAPERLRGEPHGPSSDVWALGVTLLELALGEHPFVGTADEAGATPAADGAAANFWNLARTLKHTEDMAACSIATAAAVNCAAALCRASAPADPHTEATVGEFTDLLRRMLAARPEERDSVHELLGHGCLQ